VASYNGDLYVAGEFDGIGFDSASNIARWNGSFWSASFGGLTDEFGDPYNASGEDLYVFDNKLIVTGYFLEAGGQALENFAAYDGSTWGTLGSDPSFFSDGAFTLGEYDGELLVYDGATLTYSWNGFGWGGSIFGGAAFCFGQWNGNLVVGGIFGQMNFTSAENLIRFDGSTWHAMAEGDGARRVLAFAEWDGKLAAGGAGTAYGDASGSLVATWDGSDWAPVGEVAGVSLGFGRKVECLASYQGDLIAGGDFLMADGNPVQFVARFDGTSWHPMGAGSTSTVHALTVFNNELYGGIYESGNGVRRWDGSAWQIVGGTANSFITALGEYNGQLVVGGNFSNIGGTAVTGLATWNGSAWVAIGNSALNGTVYGLALKDGKLYIAGTFTSVDGGPANRVAVWDGSTWAAVGNGVNNRIFDMVVFGGDIIVTGEFTADGGGAPLNRIARWDGSSWQPMGSGIDDDGQALGSFQGKLFVGGDFTHAGGTAARGISSWGMVQTSAQGPLPAGDLGRLRAFPNPLRTRTAVAFELMTPGDAALSVFDLRGRRVSLELFPGLAAGQHELPWDGHDEGGRPVAAGVYFLRVQAGAEVVQGRVTVVR
jgi:hypothetical protein